MRPLVRSLWLVGLLVAVAQVAHRPNGAPPNSAFDVRSAHGQDSFNGSERAAASAAPRSSLAADEISLPGPDGKRAFGYLERICALGPRVSGSAGMKKQRELLIAHFEKLGGKVTQQRFLARNPLGGPKVTMSNLIIEWHPEKQERIILCAHYDTRPFPDRDPNPAKRQMPIFLGANDGASGTALLMELGHLMPELQCRWGVDFVLFDGEELVYNDRRDPYFLGSRWFARKYRAEKPDHRYKWAVLLDMVGDADLQIFYEQNSYSWRDTRPLVEEIWQAAAELNIREFIPQRKHQVLDDHLPLRNIAGIPACDIIDFDYRFWHTASDLPEKCSGESLETVGNVLMHWLRSKP